LTAFRLQFHPARVGEIAGRYDWPGPPSEAQIIADGVRARAEGKYRYGAFRDLYKWKTLDRRRGLLEGHSPAEVEEATRLALDPETPERMRMTILTGLDGVGYPVASCVLHFAHRDPYPILDRRARESLGDTRVMTQYRYSYWQEYVAFCRQLAKQLDVSMRDLDRALWTWPGLDPVRRAAMTKAPSR
jgi:hypothetical protein